jgi:hypothetical protein
VIAGHSLFWWLRTVAIFGGMGGIFWSGIRPGRDDSRKWYDRAIRAVGGAIILTGLGFGLILILKLKD